MTISFGEGELAKIITDHVNLKFKLQVQSIDFFDAEVEVCDLSVNVNIYDESDEPMSRRATAPVEELQDIVKHAQALLRFRQLQNAANKKGEENGTTDED